MITLKDSRNDQQGFVTMIVIMLALLIGSIILVYLRVKSAQGL